VTTLDCGVVPDSTDAKRARRRELRTLRTGIDDPAGRSARIWDSVRVLPSFAGARVVLLYDAVPGEPETADFAAWCASTGRRVVVPEAAPTAAPPGQPDQIDVAIVPGLGFTASGERLGQGGGWYDRVLTSLRPDAVIVGVCFDEQVVDELPVEEHDVRCDVVVTDRAVHDAH
jgi:5-formyltetrahydrofolate cyclo-ligase